MLDLQVNVLAEVLEALPSSCVALEIDTNGRDIHNMESRRLSPFIRAVIPRLHCPGLRLKYLYPTIIYLYGGS